MDAEHSSEGQPSGVMSHPITYFAEGVHEVLDEITIVSTAGLSARSAGTAAVQSAKAEARLAALRLRLLDRADRTDVGKDTTASTEAWWAQAATADRSRARRDVELADWLTTEFHRTEIALAAGTISAAVNTLLGGLGSADLLTGHRLAPDRPVDSRASQGWCRRSSAGPRNRWTTAGNAASIPRGNARSSTPRDKICRAEGCEIPANWGHVHHLTAWSKGGRTSVEDAVTLCSRHHTTAHDPAYETTRTPAGRLRFTRIRQEECGWIDAACR